MCKSTKNTDLAFHLPPAREPPLLKLRRSELFRYKQFVSSMNLPINGRRRDSLRSLRCERRLVGEGGLEPPSLAAQDPKSCVSANFTTRPDRKKYGLNKKPSVNARK